MKDLIDISVEINESLAPWPGSEGLTVKLASDKAKGDFATNSVLNWDIHYGTHIDAPLHHIPNGKTSEEIDLDKLFGSCAVLDFSNKGKVSITREDIEKKLKDKPRLSTERILIKTDNSNWLEKGNPKFETDYCALVKSASEWMVENNIKLVGIDYYSIQKFSDPADVHEILLEAEVVILETINLYHVEEGVYDLICAPVKIKGLEGVPCRVFLKAQ